MLPTFFPLIQVNDILEREYYLITKVGLSYTEIEHMPLEYVEWFYRKHYNEEQQALNNQ